MKATQLEVHESGAIEESFVTFSLKYPSIDSLHEILSVLRINISFGKIFVLKLIDSKRDHVGKTGLELVCSSFTFNKECK